MIALYTLAEMRIMDRRMTGSALTGKGGIRMLDREKVIRGLECLAQKQAPTANPCKDCGYINRPIFAICVKDIASDALELMNGWVSVNDGLPEEKQSEITNDFEYVLCATTFGDVRAYKFGTPIGWDEPHFWHGSGLMDEYVTHWMPMPEMPDIT